MTKTFPAVTLIAAKGRTLSIAAGVLIALLSVGLFAVTAVGVPGLVAGVVAAVVVWAGLRLLSELVEVVAETLLPR